MGGKPTFCLVSLIIPKKIDTAYIDSIYDGVRSSCEHYGIQIIGGNVSSGKQLAIDIFMMGEVRPDELLLRSGAKPGDKVMVTGSLGGAAASLALNKHFVPRSRLAEAAVIAKSKLATAMIDISDGLLSDIGHICNQSNVGVVIYKTQVPVPSSVAKVEKQLHKKPLTFAFTGGEDYELLFTTPSGVADKIIDLVQRETGTPVSVIGEILRKTDGRWVQSKNGQKQPLISTGWDHLRGKA
jgi:thiamine-monophosphate kinase